MKGSTPVKYLSSRPFRVLASIAGVWAGGFYFTFQNWLVLNPPWLLLPIALAPGLILFVIWLLLGGEDSVEPPVVQRRPKTRRLKPGDQQWQVVPRD